MLVLTRKISERIVIDGGRIVIELLKTDDGRARIGIEAPADVQIKREELLSAEDREKLPPRAGRSRGKAVPA